MVVAELREHAAECVKMAQNCSSDRERLAFLELAQTWLELAQQQERAMVQSPGRSTVVPLRGAERRQEGDEAGR